MTVYRFGGGIADWAFTTAGDGTLSSQPNVGITFFSAPTGGVQYTNLTWDANGENPVPGGTVFTSDGSGAPSGEIPVFYGPPGITSMWADAGGARVLMTGDTGPDAAIGATHAAAGGNPHGSRIVDLADVSATDPTNGQTLIYSASLGMWLPSPETPMEVRTFNGRERQVVAIGEPLRPAPTRGTSGRVLYVENFRQIRPGFWNDGLGFQMRDCDIMLGGLPSLRLDTGGQQSGVVSNPGRTANTSGVITKRRIHDGYRGRFGMEAWFRFSSLNLTSTAKLSMSMYNRTGTQAHHFRVWLDPNGNNQPMHGRILDGAVTGVASGTSPTAAATYFDAVTSVSQNGAGSHTYDPASGRLDLAGGWHYVKMVVDFATLHYVSLQIDAEVAADISGYQADVTDSTGMAGMHHSFEFNASSTLRRFVNIANVTGTVED